MDCYADTIFWEGFVTPFQRNGRTTAVDYEDVEEAFEMIQAALQAKTGATQKLQEDNMKLQQQVAALQEQLYQANVAELDCGSLRDEVEMLIQVKAEICQEKAEVLRANQLLMQERDLACEQLEDFETDTRLCPACEDRISMLQRREDLERQVAEVSDENTRLRQQLQHFREFYKKSKHNWQSEQALLLQVIQLQSRTCDHLLQPSRAPSACSAPKAIAPQAPPRMRVTKVEEHTPFFSPITPTSTPDYLHFSRDRPNSQFTPPPPLLVPGRTGSPSSNSGALATPPLSDHAECAPSTSSSRASNAQQVPSPASAALSHFPVPPQNACVASPSNGVQKAPRHVQIPSRLTLPKQPLPEPSDPPRFASPTEADSSCITPELFNSPLSLSNRHLQRQPSHVGCKVPKAVPTFGIGAAQPNIQGSKTGNTPARSASSPSQLCNPPATSSSPRMTTSSSAPSQTHSTGGSPTSGHPACLGTAVTLLRHSSAPAGVLQDSGAGAKSGGLQQPWQAKRTAAVPAT